MKAEIKLTEEEVKYIIKEHLSKKFKIVGLVTIDVGTQTKGSYVGNRDGTYQIGKFNAIKVEVEI